MLTNRNSKVGAVVMNEFEGHFGGARVNTRV
jgi:hypothetical protein